MNIIPTTTTESQPRSESLRQKVYRVLEVHHTGDRLSRVVDIAIITLICASVIAVILESVESVESQYASIFYWFELFTVAIFSIE